MIPYKDASEEMKRQSQLPLKYLKSASSFAAPLAAASFYGKVAPFLSSFINEDMAIKGLSKISPKLGNFISEAKKNGFDFNKVKDFLGEKINENQESQPAKENRNIIQQYSPELHEFINGEIQKGRQPLEAGALAQLNDKFKNTIKKLEGDHKSPFSAILQSVYGGNSPKEEALKGFKEHQSKKSMMDQESERFQGYYQSQQGQSGQGQQMLAQQMQQIAQKLGL